MCLFCFTYHHLIVMSNFRVFLECVGRPTVPAVGDFVPVASFIVILEGLARIGFVLLTVVKWHVTKQGLV